jgi:hypothetical protein
MIAVTFWIGLGEHSRNEIWFYSLIMYFSFPSGNCPVFWVSLTSEQMNFLRQHAPVVQKFSFIGIIVLSFLGHGANTLSKGHDGMEVSAAPLPSLFIEVLNSTQDFVISMLEMNKMKLRCVEVIT